MIHDIAWVVLNDFASEHASVNVCVYFGCSDVLVTEHTLYDSQVCSALEKVCGK